MRSLRLSVGLLVLVGLTGCVTVDGVLKPDGSGTLTMTYALPPNPTEAKEKARFSSSHVTIDSYSMTGKTATFKATVDDVTKLSSAEGFKDVTVERGKDGTDETLTITLNNPNPIVLKDEQPGPTYSVTLPGAVKSANRDGVVSGDKVTWKFPKLSEYAKEKKIDLKVTYAGTGGGEKTATSTTTTTTMKAEKPAEKKAAPKKKK